MSASKSSLTGDLQAHLLSAHALKCAAITGLSAAALAKYGGFLPISSNDGLVRLGLVAAFSSIVCTLVDDISNNIFGLDFI